MPPVLFKAVDTKLESFGRFIVRARPGDALPIHGAQRPGDSKTGDIPSVLFFQAHNESISLHRYGVDIVYLLHIIPVSAQDLLISVQ